MIKKYTVKVRTPDGFAHKVVYAENVEQARRIAIGKYACVIQDSVRLAKDGE